MSMFGRSNLKPNQETLSTYVKIAVYAGELKSVIHTLARSVANKDQLDFKDPILFNEILRELYRMKDIAGMREIFRLMKEYKSHFNLYTYSIVFLAIGDGLPVASSLPFKLQLKSLDIGTREDYHVLSKALMSHLLQSRLIPNHSLWLTVCKPYKTHKDFSGLLSMATLISQYDPSGPLIKMLPTAELSNEVTKMKYVSERRSAGEPVELSKKAAEWAELRGEIWRELVGLAGASGLPDEALAIARSMEKIDGKRIGDMKRNGCWIRAVRSITDDATRWKDGLDLLSEMRQNDLRPLRAMWGYVISACVKTESLEMVGKLLALMFDLDDQQPNREFWDSLILIWAHKKMTTVESMGTQLLRPVTLRLGDDPSKMLLSIPSDVLTECQRELFRTFYQSTTNAQLQQKVLLNIRRYFMQATNVTLSDGAVLRFFGIAPQPQPQGVSIAVMTPSERIFASWKGGERNACLAYGVEILESARENLDMRSLLDRQFIDIFFKAAFSLRQFEQIKSTYEFLRRHEKVSLAFSQLDLVIRSYLETGDIPGAMSSCLEFCESVGSILTPSDAERIFTPVLERCDILTAYRILSYLEERVSGESNPHLISLPMYALVVDKQIALHSYCDAIQTIEKAIMSYSGSPSEMPISLRSSCQKISEAISQDLKLSASEKNNLLVDWTRDVLSKRYPLPGVIGNHLDVILRNKQWDVQSFLDLVLSYPTDISTWEVSDISHVVCYTRVTSS
jgi:hypothetical protein